jgi:hypothetical protein
MTHEKDGWDEIAEEGNGIIGPHLKYVKVAWLLDGFPVSESIKIAVVMDGATAGAVRWADSKIIERHWPSREGIFSE